MDQIDLDKYELLEGIEGQGQFGEVKRVKEKKTGKIYAAKLLFHILEGKENILSFKREVEICSKVNHPSVIQFIGYNLHNFLLVEI